jgi:predicted metalloendopeptidase
MTTTRGRRLPRTCRRSKRNYSALEIGDGPYVANVLAASRFETQRDLAKVGRPPTAPSGE